MAVRSPRARPFAELTEEWAAVESPFTFVTDGINGALSQASDVAGEHDVVFGVVESPHATHMYVTILP